MTFFQSIVLGAVQGLTEFIPVSSSGHLIIFPELFGWEDAGLAFDTTLHLGTLTALLVFFRKDILGMANALFKDLKGYGIRYKKFSRDSKFVFWLIVATVPAGLTGLFLDSFFENTFRSSLSVAVFLIAGSILMFYANKRFSQNDSLPGFTQVLKVGLFQCLALFPGFSRSGATISGGLIAGLGRQQAAKVSFLLSIPIIAAAGLLQLPEALGGNFVVGTDILVAGFISSALFGYIAVSALMKFLSRYGLNVFVIYRSVLALFLILLNFL